QQYEEVKRTFGDDTVTIVLVKAPDVFSASVLGTIRRLTEAFAKIDGVTRVDTLPPVAVLESTPPHPARHRVFVDTLGSEAGTATAIYVFTDVSRASPDFNREFTGR